MKDKRYTIELEWCGYPERRHVLRFCGEWVAQYKTHDEAFDAMVEHRREFVAAEDAVKRGLPVSVEVAP